MKPNYVSLFTLYFLLFGYWALQRFIHNVIFDIQIYYLPIILYQNLRETYHEYLKFYSAT